MDHPDSPTTVYISSDHLFAVQKQNRSRFLLGGNFAYDKFGPSINYVVNLRGAYFFLEDDDIKPSDWGVGIGVNVGWRSFRISDFEDIFFVDGPEYENINRQSENSNFSVGLFGFRKIKKGGSRGRGIKNTIYGGISLHNLSLSEKSDIQFNNNLDNLTINLVTHANLLGGFLIYTDTYNYIDISSWLKYAFNPRKITLDTPMNFNLSAKFVIGSLDSFDLWFNFAASSAPHTLNDNISLKPGVGAEVLRVDNLWGLELEIGIEFFSNKLYQKELGLGYEMSVAYVFGIVR